MVKCKILQSHYKRNVFTENKYSDRGVRRIKNKVCREWGKRQRLERVEPSVTCSCSSPVLATGSAWPYQLHLEPVIDRRGTNGVSSVGLWEELWPGCHRPGVDFRSPCLYLTNDPGPVIWPLLTAFSHLWNGASQWTSVHENVSQAHKTYEIMVGTQ